MEAVLVIDYTYDFIADDGRLTCGKPGQAIEGRLNAIVREMGLAGHYIVVASDIHYDDPLGYHPETRLYPPHNIAGTPGRALYGILERTLAEVVEAAGPGAVHRVDKTRYSAFAGTDVELRLRERRITTVHLVGVCTDICVLHTAVDAYNKGFDIVVHADAVASFNPAGHEWALQHFRNSLGARVVTADGDYFRATS